MYAFPAPVRTALVDAARRDGDVDLLEMMLLLSRAIDGDVDTEECRDQLVELGAAVRDRLDGENVERDRVEIFVDLMRDLGFRGNQEHYYDPRNSLLSEVLQRRTGIPISLSILFMEVGKLVDIELRGVSFPYHFLLKAVDVPDLYVDPFFGTTRTTASCRQLFHELCGGTLEFRDEFLQCVEERQVFVRVLRNLKEIHKQGGAVWAALEYCDMILEFDPEQPTEYRDRGSICLAIGEWNRAVDDLSTYLAMSPTADDREVILGQLQYVLTQHNSVH